MTQLQVQRLRPDAHPPQTPKHPGDVGYDLASPDDIAIPPGTTMTIPLGFALAVPTGYMGKIEGRSGLGKRGIDTHGGVIDSGYRGEVAAILHNHSAETFQVRAGDRIAQLVLVRVATPPVLEVQNLEATSRGDKGFGSTGA